MADKIEGQGKIEIKVGNLSFAAEGDQKWLAEQISKVMEAAAKIPAAAQSNDNEAPSAPGEAKKTPTGSLASYLKAKSAETKQVLRFLATAAWLSRRGEKELSTTAVTKALSDNHQKRLGNPAECLNQNCGKGFCEKTPGNRFYITPEGWGSLGEEQ